MPGNVWILLTQQGYTHPRPHRFFSSAPLVPLLLSDQKWKDGIEVEGTVEYLRGQSGSINAELKWFMNSILTCGQRLQVKNVRLQLVKAKEQFSEIPNETPGIYRQPN